MALGRHRITNYQQFIYGVPDILSGRPLSVDDRQITVVILVFRVGNFRCIEPCSLTLVGCEKSVGGLFFQLA